MNEPLVSVIIPTRNSEKTLEKCLSSIKNQSYKNTEVIVVDQSSTDSTVDVAKKYNTGILLLPPPKFYTPPTKSRNYGAKNANGDYFLHIDSDMELTPEVIEKCIEKCKNGAGAVVVHEIDKGQGFWSRCKALERSCYVDDPLIEAVRFFTREAFNKIGGYDENLSSGEDWDIHQRVKEAGFRIADIREPIIHHIGKIKFIEHIKKKYHYGKTFTEYIKKQPDMARKQFTLLRPAFLKNWRKLARDPIHTTGFLFMKCCEFSAAGIGYIKNRG